MRRSFIRLASDPSDLYDPVDGIAGGIVPSVAIAASAATVSVPGMAASTTVVPSDAARHIVVPVVCIAIAL
ncbi:hypothetical protein [Benzoatithermus flavus]|uniref:Uncharacterized protein n=1 Tax=Benzoatithermus flavus TaxID=3108223 RepID=A0ABU8XR58_9PROT